MPLKQYLQNANFYLNSNKLSIKKIRNVQIKEIVEDSQLANIAYELNIPLSCVINHIEVSYVYSRLLNLIGDDSCGCCKIINNVIFDISNFLICTIPFEHNIHIQIGNAGHNFSEVLLIFGYIWLDDKWIIYSYNHILNDFSFKGKNIEESLKKSLGDFNMSLLPKNYSHFFAKSLDKIIKDDSSGFYYLFSINKTDKKTTIKNIDLMTLFPSQNSNIHLSYNRAQSSFTFISYIVESNVKKFMNLIS